MKTGKRWELGSLAACVWVATACGNDTGSGSGATESTEAPANAASAGNGAMNATDSSAATMPATAGTAATSATTTTGAAGAGDASAMAVMPTMPMPMPKASAPLQPFSADATAAPTTLIGTATFTKTRAGVDLVVDVTGCEDGKAYPIHIHEGTSCESAMTQGGHWGAPATPAMSTTTGAAGMGAAGTGAAGLDAAGAPAAAGSGGADMPMLLYRGENIPDIVCTGGMGTTTHSRSTPDVRVIWTLGSMTDTDVVGHVVVVHDGSARIACGKIEML